MANYGLNLGDLAPLSIWSAAPKESDISPEVMLLHTQVDSWALFEFENEWSRHFKTTNWRNLRKETISSHTGIDFRTSSHAADHKYYVCHPDLTANANGHLVPWRGMRGKSEEESRARFICFMAMVLPLLKNG